ncbi:hypothetical protein [Lactobacillus gigeriorum]|uniref:Uncharacterized protein n=1 Tax=Lactobacillus gigeriorum DSM 23908 = CRBIP 24.85 TaxID=1423751 RepID=I7J3E6_9LACO|nr:hypothetical protein [Lactobacillus gigeriorum]KRN11173.1 hypothetical protein FC38_GL000853 [Lactobacillus gigeriorum DSM 23908 = CRBIP 24.85]CCI87562.1 Putative uncharacterized protein [Lactobacillus gigeriorum DSM 23908 = CRBIP 24.85]
MKKQKKWAIALISALIEVSITVTTVQAADNDSSTNQVVTQVISSDSSTNENKVSYDKHDYFSSNPKIIRVKHSTTAYKDAAMNKPAGTVKFYV